MRTGLFLLAGFLLLGTCVILAKLFSSHYPGSATTATIVFIALWLLIAAFNMWVGVTKAGYAASEELPIFLLIFAIPAIVAAILKWKFI
ncbi:MAG TPA: hypothetical protein VH814_21620 [Steroidobacteraceae bacterium]|jgi:hypothetical protein